MHKKGVMTVFKSANVECFPVADGGEGTVDAYTYNYGHKITVDCEGKTVEIGVNEKRILALLKWQCKWNHG